MSPTTAQPDDYLNKTRASTTPADMLTRKGEISQGTTIDKELQANNAENGRGSPPQGWAPNWLPNTKHSVLKSCTCKQHWPDSASCIYISAYVCSNRIKEKEARNLRRMEVEDMGRIGGRKGNGEKWCNCILINEENIAYKTEEISVLRPCSVSSSPSSLGMSDPKTLNSLNILWLIWVSF